VRLQQVEGLFTQSYNGPLVPPSTSGRPLSDFFLHFLPSQVQPSFSKSCWTSPQVAPF